MVVVARYFRSLKKINFSPRCASTTRETTAFRQTATERNATGFLYSAVYLC